MNEISKLTYRYLNEILKLSEGFERLGFYVLLFILLTHISSCIWVIIANLEDLTPQTWLVDAGLAGSDI